MGPAHYDVLYVAQLKSSLFSVSTATQNGADIRFGPEVAYATIHGREFQLGVRQGKSYALKVDIPGKIAPVERDLLHKRMGHLNFQTMEDMVRGGAVYGVKLTGVKPDFCERCAEAKIHQSPFQTRQISREAKAVNDLVHSDVVGAMKTQSFGGKKYVNKRS